MKMTFRWYGKKDTVPLKFIRQIPGMSGVVTAVYDKKPGLIWDESSVAELKKLCGENGLEMEVIESVPVHEDIKLGEPTRDLYIKNYAENIKILGKAGVKVICYNFMPVFDWVRTDLKNKNEDGSSSLIFKEETLSKIDPDNLSLPGWDESYTKQELGDLMGKYKSISHEKLFENLIYFLKGIMPACEKYNVKMAIHPDDPPWDIFGLPRIVSTEENYDKMFAAVPSVCNGMTFCTGSLGAGRTDLPRLAAKYAKEGRIHFAHLRNIKFSAKRDFAESGHLTESGSLDMYAIVKALTDNGFDGYVRPDHGRSIWDEEDIKPGYGLYDRALGAAYLNGLFEAAEKEKGKNY